MMNVPVKVLLLSLFFVFGSISVMAQKKSKKDVGLERLNDNYGGDADTSSGTFSYYAPNGKIQFSADPVSAFVNGRIYGEFQYGVNEEDLFFIGAGFHGLRKDKNHPIFSEPDPRTGYVIRAGLVAHATEYFYYRLEFVHSGSSYLTFLPKYTNWGTNYDVIEYNNSTKQYGGMLSIGVHLPFNDRFFADLYFGSGFMGGKTNKVQRNVYTQNEKEVVEGPEFINGGIGFYDLGGASIQAGVRLGIVLLGQPD